LLTIMTQLSDH